MNHAGKQSECIGKLICPRESPSPEKLNLVFYPVAIFYCSK